MKPLFCLAVPAILSLSACASPAPTAPPASMDSKAATAPAASAYYLEERHEGRIYVFGTRNAHDNFDKSKQIPQVAKTFIGAGPSGETVVFEADAKSSDLQNRLREQFNRLHSLSLK